MSVTNSINQANNMMTIPEVVSEILHFQPLFPKDAINSARAQKDKIIPELLKILDHTAEHIEEILEDSEYMGHIFSAFLLAEFRVEEAFSKIIRLLKLPDEILDSLWSDLIEDYMPRIFASVSVTSINPIIKSIEDKNMPIRIKKQLLKALMIKYLNEEYPRHELVSYFEQIMQKGLLNYEEWKNKELLSELVTIAYEIHPDELIDVIRKLFEKKLINEEVISIKKINDITKENIKDIIIAAKSNHKNKLPCDLLAEMEKWPCYNYVDFKHAKRLSKEENEEKQKFINEFMNFLNPDYNNSKNTEKTRSISHDNYFDDEENNADTAVEIHEIVKTKCVNNSNFEKAINLDDPCPCGSGLKFKKCCYSNLQNNLH